MRSLMTSKFGRRLRFWLQCDNPTRILTVGGSRLHRPSGRRRSRELRPCRKNRSFVSRVLAHYAIRFDQKRPYRPRLSLTAIAISCSDPR